MPFQFTHPIYLSVLLVAVPWVLWLTWHTYVSVGRGRKWAATVVRMLVLLLIVLALAGFEWLRPQEGMNVFYLLDRSESVPPSEQDAAREYVQDSVETKESEDRAGVVVFGKEASLESTMHPTVQLERIHAVVPTTATDLGAAIRLATAAFPETGQRRIVVLSDGNENVGDAMEAVASAGSVGVTVDAVPLGVHRTNDVIVKELELPDQVKEGQTFEAKVIVESDRATTATMRFFRNDQFLGEQEVRVQAGKNLYSFPQTLSQSGFFDYEVAVEAPGDKTPQNNQAIGYVSIEGDPRVLLVSSDPEKDRHLQAALESQDRLEVDVVGLQGFPSTLAEMDHYDSIFLSNVAAGDLPEAGLSQLQAAVRDFGVGLVCIGGDQAFGAGSYGGTPLETALPVNMELDSRKVIPKGALALVMHGMEINDGDRISRQVALGTLDAMGPQDELGMVLWDGSVRWLFEPAPVGNKSRPAKLIAGMTQGDMPDFQAPMKLAYTGLRESDANLKHMIILSDGDPTPPNKKLVQKIAQDGITISTVMIGGHVQPETMIWVAKLGGGRFYDVQSPDRLPQIFLKETAVILKSVIMEETFYPQQAAFSEILRDLGEGYPALEGYVGTTPKARAEIPLLTEQGDPLLAHWQYGLGRAVAFTADARSKWGRYWIGWERFSQFWRQLAQWSLRELETSNFDTEVTIEEGSGEIQVEAIDSEGRYLNFLDLQARVVGPSGELRTVPLEQTGTGRYEGTFEAGEVGAYQLNVLHREEGEIRGSQSVGAAVSYSPEFNVTRPNRYLLHQLVQAGDGEMLDVEAPDLSPFQHDRERTFQAVTLWPWLLGLAVLLFPIDVGIRRIQLDREQWARLGAAIRRWVLLRPAKADSSQEASSLDALLARHRQAPRSGQAAGPTAASSQAAAPGPGRPSGAARPPSTASGRTDQPPAGGEETGSEAEKEQEGETPERTTSRLLDAKRRAQRRRM